MSRFVARSPWFLLATHLLYLLAAPLHAQLKSEPASLDLGRQRQEQTARGVVSLVNTGSDPLEITHVSADCSCTTGEPEKRQLAPGEATRLEISVETRTYEGELKRRVQIETTRGHLTIPVKVTVSAFTNWAASTHHLVFPPTMKGKETEMPLTFTYTAEGSAEIKAVTVTPPVVTASIAGREGKVTTITLKKPADLAAGNHTFHIIAETTDAENPQLKVNGFVPVSSRVKVSPNPLMMPPTKPGQRVSLPLRISGWEPKEDPHFYLLNGEGKVSMRDGQELAAEISVTPAIAGTFTQVMQIFAGDRLEIEVPVLVRAE